MRVTRQNGGKARCLEGQTSGIIPVTSLNFTCSPANVRHSVHVGQVQTRSDGPLHSHMLACGPFAQTVLEQKPKPRTGGWVGGAFSLVQLWDLCKDTRLRFYSGDILDPTDVPCQYLQGPAIGCRLSRQFLFFKFESPWCTRVFP